MKKVITGILGVSILLMSGCSLVESSNIKTPPPKSTQVNILATTDLHGVLSYELSSYVKEEKQKDENNILVDAGDFFDSSELSGSSMKTYFEKRYENREKGEEKYIEVPIANDMKEVGYDAVVLGNHEFISNNKFYLDNMVSDFEKQGIDVLSANTYKQNGEKYVKPYTIKEVPTDKGNVKVGILGLTIKEVAGKKHKSRELKDLEGYNGELYMNDLVEDAQKWVNIMKEKEKTDIIITVAHSGEKPKKPKNPGNRIQELATEVEGIDAIVAGHTHKKFAQHNYKNKSGETVIVTQPGKHSECISKISFQLEKNNDKWDVVSKSSKIKEFEKSVELENYEKFLIGFSELDENIKEANLSEVIDFDWDKAYVFEPYTNTEKIYKTIGYKFRNISQTDSEDMLFSTYYY